MGITALIFSLTALVGLAYLGWHVYALVTDLGLEAVRQRQEALEDEIDMLRAVQEEQRKIIDLYQKRNYEFAQMIVERLGIATPEQKEKDLTLLKGA